jgi:hypothetical protein
MLLFRDLPCKELVRNMGFKGRTGSLSLNQSGSPSNSTLSFRARGPRKPMKITQR